MISLVAVWWNGKWGHMVRRNIYLRTDDISYEVEASEDAGEGPTRYWVLPDEVTALARVADLMDDDDGWRETTDMYPEARGLTPCSAPDPGQYVAGQHDRVMP